MEGAAEQMLENEALRKRRLMLAGAIGAGCLLGRCAGGRREASGLTWVGLRPAAAELGRPAAGVQREYSAREALRTSAFWLLSLGHGFALLIVYAVNVHAITHMKEGLGYSVAQAALVITLMTAAQVGGVLVGWTIGDRFEKRFIAAVCMLMHAAGLLMLTYAPAW